MKTQLKTQDPNAWGLFNASLPKVYFLWGSIPITILSYSIVPLFTSATTVLLGLLLFSMLFVYQHLWVYAVYKVHERRELDFWMFTAVVISLFGLAHTWVEILK